MNAGEKQSNLYKRVVAIVHDYLGPASERFVERQVRNHLNKEPETITTRDLDALVDWIGMAASLLTEDEKIVKALKQHLQQLQNSYGNNSK